MGPLTVNSKNFNFSSVSPVPSEMTWDELIVVSNVAISARKDAQRDIFGESFEMTMILVSRIIEMKRVRGISIDPDILDGDLIGVYCVCLSLERMRRIGKISMIPLTVKEIFTADVVSLARPN